MKCVISGANLKIWGRGIHALATVGDDDIHFQFTESNLMLTTFDSSLSVCCNCVFFKNFFIQYEVPEQGSLSCRIPSKCLLKPFRSIRFLTKSVTVCEIDLQSDKDAMEVILTCKAGTEIRYMLNLTVETEALQVDCDVSLLRNWIKSDPKLILGSLSNFTYSKGVADLTLKTVGNKLFLKNCMTDMIKKEGRVYTELTLNSVDFTEYAIEEDTELTFPMREFKIFATLAEHLRLGMSVHFQGANNPVIVNLKNEFYEASLTLATKIMTLGSGTQSSQGSSVTSTDHTITSVQSQPLSERPTVTPSVSHIPTPIRIPRKKPAPPPVLIRPPEVEKTKTPVPFEDDDSFEHNFDFNDFLEDANEVVEIVAPTVNQGASSSTSAPVRILERVSKQRGPPHKRMKTLFPNLGKERSLLKRPPGHDIVLVPGSDDEGESDED